MPSSRIYLDEILKQVPRLLGLLNRNPLSQNYGCFDRQYWQYKITDTSSARCQEGVLTLALLYRINDRNNIYYQNDLVLEWINAGIRFWCNLQENNGSFNEWYPSEHSFVSTSFSSYAISETLLLLGEKISTINKVLICLRKSCSWISTRMETRVQNQESGAVLALHNLFLLTGEKKWKFMALKKVKYIIKSQTDEGWFNEYGGPDLGYLSLTVDYLSKYYHKTKNPQVLSALKKAVNFISYFLHPNFTFGGEYGSRNTEYMIPSSFEFLAKHSNDSKIIAKFNRVAISTGSMVNLSSLDDRYLSYIAYNWIHAFQYGKLNGILKIKDNDFLFSKHFNKYFYNAGIYIFSNSDNYIIVNCNKGGSFKLFKKDSSMNKSKTKVSSKVIYDSGILINLVSGSPLMSGYLDKDTEVILKKGYLEIRGKFSKIKNRSLSPLVMILLRTFQVTFGRNQKVGMFVKEKLRDKLISNNSKSDHSYVRRFLFTEGEIIDQVFGKNIKTIILSSKFSFSYTPSSRYFQESELDNSPTIIKNSNKKTKLVYRRQI
tara:strand:- start:9529 stop:11163 length:1635 start_codon:yes stop_codon:yes gene_type:complete